VEILKKSWEENTKFFEGENNSKIGDDYKDEKG